MSRLRSLFNKLDYHFKNEHLAKEALAHASIIKIKQSTIACERFEFLGDRLLGLIIASYLFENFPQETEGQLAKRHAQLVSSKTIALVMNGIQLKNYIDQELEHNIIPERVISNMGESLIAAIFLDSNYDTVRAIVLALWIPIINAPKLDYQDPKSDLQVYAQQQYNKVPRYHVILQSGTSHQPQFKVSVTLDGGQSAVGTGTSKREAERMAALTLLTDLKIL